MHYMEIRSNRQRATEQTRQDVPYFSRFYAKSWLNDLEDEGQGQRLIRATHPPMPVIIFAKYGKNPSRTEGATERIHQDVSYVSKFYAKSWVNDLGHMGQAQRSLHVMHPLLLVVIYAKYGKNPSRTIHAPEQT